MKEGPPSLSFSLPTLAPLLTQTKSKLVLISEKIQEGKGIEFRKRL
jgi:hypothetical protein